MSKQKTSRTFRFLKLIGFNYSEEEYGQIRLSDAIGKCFISIRNTFLVKHIMTSSLLAPLLPTKVRPWALRVMGCHVGKNVFIGSDVWIDTGNASLITIDDHVHVTGRTVLLCHKRELSDYYVGDDYATKAYIKAPIHLCKGCSTGTGTIIMPGVTVGEGAVIGAGSIVTRDIPAWSIALGQPATVVRKIESRK